MNLRAEVLADIERLSIRNLSDCDDAELEIVHELAGQLVVDIDDDGNVEVVG
jgi:predicted amino acid racemase